MNLNKKYDQQFLILILVWYSISDHAALKHVMYSLNHDLLNIPHIPIIFRLGIKLTVCQYISIIIMGNPLYKLRFSKIQTATKIYAR